MRGKNKDDKNNTNNNYYYTILKIAYNQGGSIYQIYFIIIKF